jgi:hypothetical protein
MIGIGSLLGLGWVLIALTTVRAMQSDASVFSRTVGLAIPVALALTLFAGAAGIVLYGLEGQAFRISVWTCVGGVRGVNRCRLEHPRPRVRAAGFHPRTVRCTPEAEPGESGHEA